jgi:hypothetical protein
MDQRSSSKGFDHWVVVAGFGYFAVMAAMAAILKQGDLRVLWFRTAFPATFAGAAVLQWLFWPGRRPRAMDYWRMFVERIRRHPGWTIWAIGGFVVVGTSALMIPLTITGAEKSLPPFEIALMAAAAVALVGGFILRRAFPAPR